MKDIGGVVAAVRAAKRPMCVFDLDSTLMNTAPRNWRILQEAAHIYPALTPFVAKLTESDMGYTVTDDLRRVGCHDVDLLETLHEFWKTRFFTNEYVVCDRPYPGAVAYVRRIYEAGALIYYLSGRDEPGMGRGTRQSLDAHGFPLGERTILHLKPAFSMPDIDFKRAAFDDIERLGGTVVAVFENEPANANAFKERFPESAVFLIRTITSLNPSPLRSDVIPFTSFAEGR